MIKMISVCYGNQNSIVLSITTMAKLYVRTVSEIVLHNCILKVLNSF